MPKPTLRCLRSETTWGSSCGAGSSPWASCWARLRRRLPRPEFAAPNRRSQENGIVYLDEPWVEMGRGSAAWGGACAAGSIQVRAFRLRLSIFPGPLSGGCPQNRRGRRQRALARSAGPAGSWTEGRADVWRRHLFGVGARSWPARIRTAESYRCLCNRCGLLFRRRRRRLCAGVRIDLESALRGRQGHRAVRLAGHRRRLHHQIWVAVRLIL